MSKARNLGDAFIETTDGALKWYSPNAGKMVASTAVMGTNYLYYDMLSITGVNGGSQHAVVTSFSANTVRSPFITMMCKGYISSGTYYWSWNLYNSTQGFTLCPLSQATNNSSYTGQFGSATTSNANMFGTTVNTQIGQWGATHSISSQHNVVFDISQCTTGDTIQVRLSCDNNGQGGTLNTNGSQTIYMDDIRIWTGVVGGADYSLTNI